MSRMFDLESGVNEPEMQVVDLRDDGEFMTRENRARGLAMEVSGIQRLANGFRTTPKEDSLRELVELSVDMCGAASPS